jgi:hypothetical protein
MTFTIHASKDGHMTQTLRIDPEIAVEGARPIGHGLGSAYHGPGGPTISPRGIRPPLLV